MEHLKRSDRSRAAAGEDWQQGPPTSLTDDLAGPPGDVDSAPVDADQPGRLLARIIDTNDEAVALYDAVGRILFTNQAYHRIFDHHPSPIALRGMSHEDLYRLDLEAGVIDDPLARSDPEAFLQERMRIFQTLRHAVTEVQSIKGRSYLYTRSRLGSGETLSRRIDITKIKNVERRLRASQRRLEQIAYVDQTTGLANRIRFRERVDAELAAGRYTILVAVINLDRFKAINDGMGDAAGDAVLALAAKRLRGCLRSGDLLARLGSDEFGICCPDLSGGNGVKTLSARIFRTFREPFAVGDRRLAISVSLGFAGPYGQGATTNTLLQQAALALRAAKRAGGTQARCFDAAMEAAQADRRMLALDLREAVALGQLQLHYQPLMSCRDQRVRGVEALVRWQHPTRGMISPADFIQIAEETGLICLLGSWVLNQAIDDARNMPPDFTVAVNLSPRQIAQSDIVDIVERTARQHDFDLRRLELEITESYAFEDDHVGIETLSRLRSCGVGISLDDFGTGYSSLSYLLSFPFTKIKIDKSFIGAMLHRSDAAAIVTAVVDLAKRLRMTTTAEGVETAEQLDHLIAVGCSQAQGFLVARPLPMPELRAWLAARPSGTAHVAPKTRADARRTAATA